MKTENVVKKVAFLIAFVLVTSGTAFGAAISPSTSTAEYWAVIVGGNSVYAHHDAADMYNALNRASENWDAGHIRFLVNENATKANIRDAIQWMANEASAEDTCIFYFTGHGKNCRDLNGDENDGLDELISTFYNEVILDDELEKWLDEVKAQKKVAILDACYSGGVLTPHQIEDEASDTFDLGGFASDLEKANCHVLASCQANESSSDVDGLNNGIFTYYIVQGLWGAADENDDARISVRELYDYSYTKTVEFQEIVLNQEEEPQQPLLWPEEDTAKNVYLITLKKSVPKEIKVPDDYRTIQEAVEAAMPGDVIEVSTGFYNENVIINKPLAVNAPHQDSVIQAADTSLPCMLITVDNTSISGLSCQKGSYGIWLMKSNNGCISNCSCSNNEDHGIFLVSSENNSLSHNNCSNNEDHGIFLVSSENNSLSHNNCSNNEQCGILLYDSRNNSLSHSTCLNNDRCGIMLDSSGSNSILNSTCSNNEGGIILKSSTNNTLTGNTANLNEQYHGIALIASNNNGIIDNNASNNFQCGIALFESSNNNAIIRNTASNNENGIYLYFSKCNTLRNNLMYGNRYNFGVDSYSDFENDIDTSNTVDGKTIYYWIDRQDEQIPDDAGVVVVVNSMNITVRDLTLTNNRQGVLFAYTLNSKIENVTALNNWDGIRLMSSSNNTLMNNNVLGNDCDGIWLWDSSNYNLLTSNTVRNNNYSGIRVEESNSNKIYLNNFINNNDTVHSENSTNIWNTTEEIPYTYSSFTYTNHMGNYWIDYTDIDSDSNGIWDNPYIIDSDRDYQPLVMPGENYFAAPKNVLDTGQPANPYPSIMGNHTGTIKTNHTIIATKLYTYHCEGTGGHTEYAKIWNATWDATAAWEGYCSDWNNIVFDKPVVLLANETYNYTIRTGSYPQIHHNKILTLPDGEFTCLKFTDANGRVYYDMIPAIRLFQ